MENLSAGDRIFDGCGSCDEAVRPRPAPFSGRSFMKKSAFEPAKALPTRPLGSIGLSGHVLSHKALNLARGVSVRPGCPFQADSVLGGELGGRNGRCVCCHAVVTHKVFCCHACEDTRYLLSGLKHRGRESATSALGDGLSVVAPVL
jgi:hypothetical protein